MLDVRDVNRALDLLIDIAPGYKGSLFNLGGGSHNAISLIEAIRKIAECTGKTPRLEYTDWRPQDNKVYISNCEKLASLGWRPRILLDDMISHICEWVREESSNLEAIYT